MTLPRNKHTIDCFGSCVSIDWFYAKWLRERIAKDNVILNSRTEYWGSVTNAISKPFPVELETSPITKNSTQAQLRAWNTAFNKPFFNALSSGRKPGEYFIFDCCVERFGLFLFDGLRIADFGTGIFETLKSLNRKDILLISKSDYLLTRTREVETVVSDFCNLLLKYYDERKIIINEVFYTTKVILEGKVQPYPPDKVAIWNRANFIIKWYYDEIKRHLPNARVLKMLPNLPSGDDDGVHFAGGEFYTHVYESCLRFMKEDEDSALVNVNKKLREELESLKSEMDALKNKGTPKNEEM
jgi:hypothetical protein